MKDWFVKKILMGYLKGFLDKLPADGLKTILGIILIVASELVKLLPEYSGPLSFVLDLLKQLGAAPIQDAGIVALLVGLVHKALKYADRGKK